MNKIVKENPWYEVCLNCTHSYRTKDNEKDLKCRCRKGCRFDDIGLKK